MTSVLISRHGESVWNVEGRAQGLAPVPLTTRGCRQARELGNYLTENYDVTDVYSSPVRRATETVTEAFHGDTEQPNVEETPNLREREVGMLRGFKYGYTRDEYPEYFSDVDGEEAPLLKNSPPDGESTYDVYERVNDWWQSFIDTQDAKGDVLVMGHGAVCRCFEAIISGVSLEATYSNRDQMDNCGLWVVEPTGEDGEFIAQYPSVADLAK